MSFTDNGVIYKTKALRKIYKLDFRYVILSQNGIAIFMKIISDNKSQIIVCNEIDDLDLFEGESIKYNPTVFASFTDFYAFLIDEEENLDFSI